MPVKLDHDEADAEARIEIIPLIDIMFFLLASFMLVSLSMVNLKSVKVDLPTATTASAEKIGDAKDLTIDARGGIFLDRQRLADPAIVAQLVRDRRSDSRTRVLISGDADARHGDVIHALDLVRQAGIDRVAFQTSTAPVRPTAETPGTP